MFMPLVAPWGGTINILRALTSGDNQGISTISHSALVDTQRTFETNYWVMPHPEIYSDRTLISVSEKMASTLRTEGPLSVVHVCLLLRRWVADTRIHLYVPVTYSARMFPLISPAKTRRHAATLTRTLTHIPQHMHTFVHRHPPATTLARTRT